MQEKLQLINMENVEVEQVKWLWYPYIPFGKLTVMQGDPGEGKTTSALAIAASVTTGGFLPESKEAVGPANVIFQTAEDGLGDTVKPRLIHAGADCSFIHVIDESLQCLSLSDSRIEEAIVATGAKLLILDPIQAYMGSDVDMHRANEIRNVMKRVCGVADRTDCAIMVIGHLNKSGGKSQYRGLGSIDIQAAARSVLTVGRIKDKPYTRAIAQGKNNLAPEGQSIAFELNPETGFNWLGVHPITIDELLSGSAPGKDTAHDKAVDFLKTELTIAMPAQEVLRMAGEKDISKRTLYNAKSVLGIKSIRQDGQWYWAFPQDSDPKQDCNIAGV